MQRSRNLFVGEFLISVSLGLISLASSLPVALATPPRTPDQTVNCEILVVGGGLAGAATAYEGLFAGKTVCLTEITDWVGGQISSQGTSALDERATQRERLFFPRGYLELRQRIQNHYGELNPGDCWVSVSCFLPRDGHFILFDQLQDAAKQGKGTLKWFPSTAIKEVELNRAGNIIQRLIIYWLLVKVLPPVTLPQPLIGYIPLSGQSVRQQEPPSPWLWRRG